MLTTDRVAGAALVVVGLVAVWQSLQFPFGSLHRPGPAYVPVLLAVLLIVFGLAVAALGGASRRLDAIGWAEWRHAVAIFATCAFAAVALERLGYRLTMSMAMAFLLLVLERKPLVSSIAVALAVGVGSFYLFDTVLRVPLPRGPLGL
jgi:putative tricarboxylic transport membrane protein